MNKFLPFISIFTAAAMLLASGMMLHSVIEFRATMRLDPELERLAIAYYRDQQERREYGRKVDEANRKAERDVVLPMPTQPQLLFRGSINNDHGRPGVGK